MDRWRAGYLLCISAGIAMVIAAFLPLAQSETLPPRTYTALAMHYFGPFVTMLAAGVALIVLGYLRTPWAALVAMSDAMASIVVLLMIHGDLDARLAAIGVDVTGVGHPYGYGYSVVLAAGALAFVASVVTSVQTAPPVRT